ncbi:MAG: phosphomannomutase [Candidatus Moraniibacteriota bacterium]
MLKFGTSGLRGLVEELTDQECYLYTRAFLEHLNSLKLIKKGGTVAIAGDFRPSTTRILKACMMAIEDVGFKSDYCGIIPTPAVSFYSFQRKIPSLMVTGSYIPYDRNGIKFNLPQGEVLKRDEKNITKYYQKISASGVHDNLFDKAGKIKKKIKLPRIIKNAEIEYIKRYVDFFEKNFLQGKMIVVFQHSSVVRDIMVEILKKLGAKVVSVGRSEKFIPIDTEAMAEVDIANAEVWVKKYKADAVISADGDGDRPILFDENGEFIRGDFLGVIVATYLKADSVSVTASSNTVLEKTGKFKKINRTKIGSPYIIEAMNSDIKKKYKKVVSFEANGGFLTGSVLEINKRKLFSLPTRDAMLPVICALAFAKEKNKSLSELVKIFPQRFVYSQSIKGFPTEKSLKILEKISKKDENAKKIAEKIFNLPVKISRFDFTDGARMFLANGEIIHVRPSGNSPELRVYYEAESFGGAKEMAERALGELEKMKN